MLYLICLLTKFSYNPPPHTPEEEGRAITWNGNHTEEFWTEVYGACPVSYYRTHHVLKLL